MLTLVPYRRNRALVQRPVNTLFNDSFFRSFFDMSDAVGNVGFRVDVREEENRFILEAELPGVNEDQINLTVDEGTLKISADTTTNTEENTDNYCYRERRVGHMERRFSLENIKEEDIKADYKNGILTIELPKAQPEPQKIERRIAINGIQPKIEEAEAAK